MSGRGEVVVVVCVREERGCAFVSVGGRGMGVLVLVSVWEGVQ